MAGEVQLSPRSSQAKLVSSSPLLPTIRPQRRSATRAGLLVPTVASAAAAGPSPVLSGQPTVRACRLELRQVTKNLTMVDAAVALKGTKRRAGQLGTEAAVLKAFCLGADPEPTVRTTGMEVKPTGSAPAAGIPLERPPLPGLFAQEMRPLRQRGVVVIAGPTVKTADSQQRKVHLRLLSRLSSTPPKEHAQYI